MFNGDAVFIQGFRTMANSPCFAGMHWINYEEVSRLIETLPQAQELALPIFEEKLSAQILRSAISFTQLLQINHDTYRYWNTQAVIRLCNKYSFHAKETTENVMIQRLKTQNFYTPIFEAPVVMQHPSVLQPLPMPSPAPKQVPAVEGPGRKLFVVNYPSAWDSNVLTNVFGQYGEVTRCKTCGKFAFVTMRTSEDAFKARMSLHGARIEEGSTLTVTVANGNVSRNSKVFLQNIPVNWTEEDIERQLTQYGEVIGCHLIHEKKYMNTKCAIVRFINDCGAKKAIQRLNEAPIMNPYMPNSFLKIQAEHAISDKRAMPPKETQVPAGPVTVKQKAQNRIKEVMLETKMLQTLFEAPMTLSRPPQE